MGVSKFFYYFLTNKEAQKMVYPITEKQTSKDIVIEGEKLDFDIVLIDLNAIYHPNVQKVMGESKKVIEKPKSLLRHSTKKETTEIIEPVEVLVKRSYQRITENIDKLIEYTNPKQVLYLAVDGVAGLSKQTQQRQRRFGKFFDNNKEPGDNDFDTNAISPGTKFMDELNIYIKNYIKSKLKKEWKHLNIIFNDSTVVGEGEHKLIDYLRRNDNQNLSSCIISPDADLFMLSLGLKRDKVFIFRPNAFIDSKNKNKLIPEGDFYFIDIDKFKTYILNEINIQPKLQENRSLKKDNTESSLVEVYKNSKQSVDNLQYSKNRIIEDFVLYIMMIGNDFLPHLPAFVDNKDAIPILFDKYKFIVNKYGFLTNRTETDIEINYSNLKQLFYELSKDEKRNLKDNAKFLKNTEQYNFPDRLLYKNLTNLKPDGSFDVNIESYKKDYYIFNLKFGRNINFNEDISITDYIGESKLIDKLNENIDSNRLIKEIKDHVKEYIRGLLFVLKYYLFKIPTYNWFFPYHYGPFFSDLYQYFPENENFEFSYEGPVSSFEQLLCVLPPQSHKLIPNPLQYLMLSEDSPIRDLYPSEFKEDLEGSRRELERRYHRKFLLPFADINRIKAVFNEIKSKLSEQDKKRNEFGNIYEYYFSNKDVVENIRNF